MSLEEQSKRDTVMGKPSLVETCRCLLSLHIKEKLRFYHSMVIS